MAWRRFENHKEESREVKRFMISQGYQNVKVGHGRGTAWGWLEVDFSISRPADCYCNKPGWEEVRKNEMTISCLNCGREYGRVRDEVNKKLMEFTGRHGDYNGDMNLHIEWLEIASKIEVEAAPAPQPEPEPAFNMGWFEGE